MVDINEMIRRPIAKVYRRAYVKRRSATTGLFESTWQEITKYVKRWGSYKQSIDYERLGLLTIEGTDLVVSNVDGKFSPADVDSSLWYGYADQQRSLVKIEAGFVHTTLAASGIYTNTEYPGTVFFKGIISGNLGSGTDGEIAIPLKPLTKVFQDFPANMLYDFTSTGQTASRFITAQLRDQSAGTGSFIFRPFFDDTTSSWSITSTTVDYTSLGTTTATRISGKSAWDVVENLAQCEQFIPWITRTGAFIWSSKTVGGASVFTFNGVGTTLDPTYGLTIKNVVRYGRKLSNYYSSVVVQFTENDTGYCQTSTSLAISGTNNPWNLGFRQLKIENLWIPNSTTAASIANIVLAEVSSNANELEFVATFHPTINILDRITVNYDPAPFELSSLWDYNDWDTELTWHSSTGDFVVLDNAEFKVLSVDIDLDSLVTRIIAREI